MTRKVYAVRDAKAECFGNPIFLQSHGEAERSFDKVRKDPQSMVNQYPDDYDLYYLGEYDDQKGIIISLDTPQHMLKAAMIKMQ